MHYKAMFRPILDLTMLSCMLLALAFQLTGNTWHEIIGIVMLMAFIVHNIVNYKWYQALGQGRYPVIRIVNLIINLFLLMDMLVLMISGILSSQVLFKVWFNGDAGFSLRQIHTAAAYWGLLLISIHLGNHWQLISSKLLKLIGYSARYSGCLQLVAMGIAGYGIVASFRMNLGAKLISYYTFTYWDFEESTVIFFVDYLAIMWLYGYLTYWTMKILVRRKLTANRS